MHCRTITAAEISESFIDQFKAQSEFVKSAPRLRAFLTNNNNGSRMYANFARKTSVKLGFNFEICECNREDLEEKIIEANEDSTIGGIMIFYPVFASERDQYIRDMVDPSKDVEGLSHFWVQRLYHNVRFIDSPKDLKKSVLPCTPLAIVKVLEYLQIYNSILHYGNRLYGRTICVINRSEVVGRPLAVLLANDGGCVYSVDVTGVQLYTRGEGIRNKSYICKDTDLKLENVLPLCDVIISGVPSESFKVDPQLIRDGATCINFAGENNFEEEATLAKAGIFVPSVGKVTIAMLLRNFLRLHEHRLVPESTSCS